MKPQPLLTVSEVNKLTGWSERTIRLWCRNGRIPGAWQPGGHSGSWYIPRRALAILSVADIADPGTPDDTQGD